MLNRLSGRPAIRAGAAPQDLADDDGTCVEVTFAGRTFKLDPADGADQVARDIMTGTYEAPLPMLMMASLVRIDGAFVDVGANTGLYSVMAAVIAPGRPILAFEPLPLALAALRRNIAANDIRHAIAVHESALSDHSGKATLHIPDPSHGLIETSASLEADFKPRNRATTLLEVTVATLDSVDIPGPIGVIKVDIEGHEHAFLEGARATIARERPIVFIELLQGAPSHRIRHFVREMGYVDFRLRPDLAIHDGGEILYDPLAWNHALVPAERLLKFQEACQSCGLAMLRRFVPA
ncbi:FkbM family methyltransferase [Methylobacterium terricola]|nr:FkbM family methyltransferase [Methylobacterium terricola]